MPVPEQIPVTSSIANGVTTTFPYDFKIINAADLSVTVDDVLVTTGFVINGVGQDEGGDVVFDVAPENGSKVVRFLNPVLSRVTDYQQFGDWIADIVNADFDRIWTTLQYLAQLGVRTIQLPVDTLAAQIIEEGPEDRANKVITFDVDGNVALKAGTELIPEVDTAVTNALAAAASAESSASAAVSSADAAAASALAASTTPVAAPTHLASSKTTPVDADEIPLIDSADSFGLKRLTWANLKAALKTYFDTLYNLVTVVNTANDPTFASTSATAAISPQWWRGASPFTKSYESSQQVITSAGTLTLAHGMGKSVKTLDANLVCATSEFGWAVNDVVGMGWFAIGSGAAAASQGFVWWSDSTNLYILFGSAGSVFQAPNKSTANLANLTNANWRIVFKAWG